MGIYFFFMERGGNGEEETLKTDREGFIYTHGETNQRGNKNFRSN